MRTEWVIFHEEMRIGGSIDFVYQDESGRMHIVDWKRSSRIHEKLDNPWQVSHARHGKLAHHAATENHKREHGG